MKAEFTLKVRDGVSVTIAVTSTGATTPAKVRDIGRALTTLADTIEEANQPPGFRGTQGEPE